MLPAYIRTIRDEIFYEYAKLISRSTFGTLQRGFITDIFKHLRDGQMETSDVIRESQREREVPHECVYCGSKSELSTDHLIPLSRGGNSTSDNLVVSCTHCNSSRGAKGIFEWLGLREKDHLHGIVAGKYLRQLFHIHEESGTLGVDRLTLYRLCTRCPLPDVCKKWNTAGELSCFCLESLLPKNTVDPTSTMHKTSSSDPA